MIHRVETSRSRPQPWRNGGGMTRELLVWPPGSGADWQLRVSVADIERDGPFSPFPGVQRCFAVLEGQGVVLRFGQDEHRLETTSPPLAFDGAEAPGCRLLAGPTRDLNLMAVHSAGTPRMRRARLGDRAPTGGLWCGLYVADALSIAQWDVSRPAEHEAVQTPLPAHTLAWCDEPGSPWGPPWGISAAAGSAAPPAPRAWWLLLEATA